MDFNIITKYEVGDIVLIDPELCDGIRYKMVGMDYGMTLCANSNHFKFSGKLATIVSVSVGEGRDSIYGYYLLDIDNQKYEWTDEMFIDLNGKFGILKNGKEFVIANQIVIYNPKQGGWDNLSTFTIRSSIRKISKRAKSFSWLEDDLKKDNDDELFYMFEKTPEYTMDELVKIVGHEFKLVKK